MILFRRKGEPGQADLQADNYQKRRMTFQGMPIDIENEAGSIRRGRGWETRMLFAYGEIPGTMGVDGDPHDVYVGPNESSLCVYIITQMGGKGFTQIDEQKTMLGFDSAEAAKDAYLRHYDDPRFFGAIQEMPVAEFRQKVMQTKSKPALIKAIVLFKSHVKGYVKKDGTFVKPHEDKRVKNVQANDSPQLSLFDAAAPKKKKPVEYMKPRHEITVEPNHDDEYGDDYSIFFHTPGGDKRYVDNAPTEEEAQRKAHELRYVKHIDDEGGAHDFSLGEKRKLKIPPFEYKPEHEKPAPAAPKEEESIFSMMRDDLRAKGLHDKADMMQQKHEEHLARQAQGREAKKHFEAMGGDGVELRHRNGDQWAFFLPDASEPGRYRMSTFDKRGFYGHRTFDTKDKAIEGAIEDGFVHPDSGALDKLSATDDWSKGSEATAAIQKYNEELAAKRQEEAAPAVPDTLGDGWERDNEYGARVVYAKKIKLRDGGTIKAKIRVPKDGQGDYEYDYYVSGGNYAGDTWKGVAATAEMAKERAQANITKRMQLIDGSDIDKKYSYKNGQGGGIVISRVTGLKLPDERYKFLRSIAQSCMSTLQLDAHQIHIVMTKRRDLGHDTLGRAHRDVDGRLVVKVPLHLVKTGQDGQVAEVIAHELVHIRQYATRDLGFKDGNSTWHGTAKDANGRLWDGYKYLERPWEVQAYSAQKRIAEMAMDDYESQGGKRNDRLAPKVAKVKEVGAAANAELADISKHYYERIPVGKIFDACRKDGLEPIQEDGTPWEGMLLGAEGRTSIELQGSKKRLHIAWYKMPSGRYEVTPYVS